MVEKKPLFKKCKKIIIIIKKKNSNCIDHILPPNVHCDKKNMLESLGYIKGFFVMFTQYRQIFKICLGP